MRRFPRAAQRHFEALEPRQLQTASAPAAGDGHDYVMLAPDAGKPVVRAVPEQARRASLPNGFTWFDGTASGLIARSIPGVANITCDDRNMYPTDSSGTIQPGTAIDEANTRAMARRVNGSTGVLTIDLEEWSLYLSRVGQPEANRCMARFARIIDWCKDEAPALKVGLYGEMPSRDLYAPSQFAWTQDVYAQTGSDWHGSFVAGASQNYAQWQASAAFVAPLAARCDYMFPSFYTYYDDADTWTRMARATIDTARSFGKPVIPYLWHLYHDGTPLGGTPLADADWGRELDLMRECADGAVIWNDYREPYDASASWVQAINARRTSGATGGRIAQAASASRPTSAAATKADDADDADDDDRVDDLLAA